MEWPGVQCHDLPKGTRLPTVFAAIIALGDKVMLGGDFISTCWVAMGVAPIWAIEPKSHKKVYLVVAF